MKLDERMWAGLIWLRWETRGRLQWTVYWTFGWHNVWTIVDWLMNCQLFKNNSAPGSWLVGWLVSLIILHRLFHYTPSRHRGEVAGRWIALSPLDFGARRVCVGNTTPWQLYLQEGDWVFILQEAGWASGPVCMATKYFAPLHWGSYPRLSTL
jgi:hypothetical protein